MLKLKFLISPSTSVVHVGICAPLCVYMCVVRVCAHVVHVRGACGVCARAHMCVCVCVVCACIVCVRYMCMHG